MVALFMETMVATVDSNLSVNNLVRLLLYNYIHRNYGDLG